MVQVMKVIILTKKDNAKKHMLKIVLEVLSLKILSEEKKHVKDYAVKMIIL